MKVVDVHCDPLVLLCPHVPSPNFFLLWAACLCTMSLSYASAAFAQVDAQQTLDSPLLQAVAAGPQADEDEPDDVVETGATDLPASEPFQLPIDQHAWARFLPGAWRVSRTVTETFDDEGQMVSRNVTTQKEVLQAVADGKYVLQLQAMVDLDGKRIVGDWKTRALQLATDGAGPMVGSRQLEDQAITIAGRAAKCQVWELRYRDGARNMLDVVYYQPQRYPFVLQRETFANDIQIDGIQSDAAVEVEQLMEVIALDAPFLVGEQLLGCSWLRTFHHRVKGDTVRLAVSSASVPGGDVAVWSTDFDAQGRRSLSSATSLLAFDDSPSEDDSAAHDVSAAERTER